MLNTTIIQFEALCRPGIPISDIDAHYLCNGGLVARGLANRFSNILFSTNPDLTSDIVQEWGSQNAIPAGWYRQAKPTKKSVSSMIKKLVKEKYNPSLAVLANDDYSSCFEENKIPVVYPTFTSGIDVDLSGVPKRTDNENPTTTQHGNSSTTGLGKLTANELGNHGESVAIGKLAEKGIYACKNIAAQWTGKFDLFADMDGHRIEVKATQEKGNRASVQILIKNLDNFDHLVAVFLQEGHWKVFMIDRKNFVQCARGNPTLNVKGKNDRWLLITDFERLVAEEVAERL